MLKAVIAEDEPVLRAELRDTLAKALARARHLRRGRGRHRGAARAHRYAPDILFLDIQMPGMSGLEVAKQASGKCHVVFVTAYDKYAVAAFEQGAVDYVMKPFSAARLATTVARLKERVASAPANLDGLLKAARAGRQPARSTCAGSLPRRATTCA